MTLKAEIMDFRAEMINTKTETQNVRIASKDYFLQIVMMDRSVTKKGMDPWHAIEQVYQLEMLVRFSFIRKALGRLLELETYKTPGMHQIILKIQEKEKALLYLPLP